MDITKILPHSKLDHIAIAVESIDLAKKLYEVLGFDFGSEVEVVESQKVKVAFAYVDQHARIELLEPTSADSPIRKFIDKSGEGLHHICFSVQDIALSQQKLADHGCQFIYPQPVAGAHHCLVNFIHPKSSGGVLIEISQKQS